MHFKTILFFALNILFLSRLGSALPVKDGQEVGGSEFCRKWTLAHPDRLSWVLDQMEDSVKSKSKDPPEDKARALKRINQIRKWPVEDQRNFLLGAWNCPLKEKTGGTTLAKPSGNDNPDFFSTVFSSAMDMATKATCAELKKKGFECPDDKTKRDAPKVRLTKENCDFITTSTPETVQKHLQLTENELRGVDRSALSDRKKASIDHKLEWIDEIKKLPAKKIQEILLLEYCTPKGKSNTDIFSTTFKTVMDTAMTATCAELKKNGLECPDGKTKRDAPAAPAQTPDEKFNCDLLKTATPEQLKKALQGVENGVKSIDRKGLSDKDKAVLDELLKAIGKAKTYTPEPMRQYLLDLCEGVNKPRARRDTSDIISTAFNTAKMSTCAELKKNGLECPFEGKSKRDPFGVPKEGPGGKFKCDVLKTATPEELKEVLQIMEDSTKELYPNQPPDEKAKLDVTLKTIDDMQTWEPEKMRKELLHYCEWRNKIRSARRDTSDIISTAFNTAMKTASAACPEFKKNGLDCPFEGKSKREIPKQDSDDQFNCDVMKTATPEELKEWLRTVEKKFKRVNRNGLVIEDRVELDKLLKGIDEAIKGTSRTSTRQFSLTLCQSLNRINKENKNIKPPRRVTPDIITTAFSTAMKRDAPSIFPQTPEQKQEQRKSDCEFVRKATPEQLQAWFQEGENKAKKLDRNALSDKDKAAVDSFLKAVDELQKFPPEKVKEYSLAACDGKTKRASGGDIISAAFSSAMKMAENAVAACMERKKKGLKCNEDEKSIVRDN
ncbi:hypothetical protein FQN50_007139 [Emmonsiellopsis sp. PD_5]|nr:hypothetical protein FQN50_007139 [Emmonsiellopsis sp. PD_5]